MKFFEGRQNQENSDDVKIAALENDAQERIRRIGALRAQISGLAAEETKLEREFAEKSRRVEELRERRDELERLSEREDELTEDVKRREVKFAEQLERLERLRARRAEAIQKTARLRAQISNEDADSAVSVDEIARLEATLIERKTQKEEMLKEAEERRGLENELATLEAERREWEERLPQVRKKYERTKELVEGIKNDVEPVAQAIVDIWRKLPEDILDKRLAASRANDVADR